MCKHLCLAHPDSQKLDLPSSSDYHGFDAMTPNKTYKFQRSNLVKEDFFSKIRYYTIEFKPRDSVLLVWLLIY